MTVTYTAHVATCRKHGCFWRLLFRWRGSIYKLLLPNFTIYCTLFFSLSATYRFVLNEEQRVIFENLSLMCQSYSSYIPVSFILGFYVNVVVYRWWNQYLTIPWPDSLALYVSTLIQGHQDDRSRLMRRTIMRYANVSLLMVLRMIAPAVKKRFATDDHLVEAGFLQPGEKKIIEEMEHKTKHPKYWIPLIWAAGIITRSRREGFVRDDFAVKTLIDEINKFRSGCGGLLNYDWISVPLVYTQVPPICFQVTTLVVFAFFLGSLMADQYLDPDKGYPQHRGDLYIPIFSLLQFFFYMGWLMVAEVLVNPFGEDDDDFEVNWLIDRNLQISYVIVDEMHQEHPELLKDQYWDEIFPQNLPYTAETKQFQTTSHMGSTQDVQVLRAQFVHTATDNSGSNKTYELDTEHEKEPTEHCETQPLSIIKQFGSSFSLAPSYLSTFSIFNHFKKNPMVQSQTGLKNLERNRRDEEQSGLSPTQSVWKDSKDEDLFHMSDLCLLDSSVNVHPSSRSSILSDSQELAFAQKYIKKNESFTSFESSMFESHVLNSNKVSTPFNGNGAKILIRNQATTSNEINSNLLSVRKVQNSYKEEIQTSSLATQKEIGKSITYMETVNETTVKDSKNLPVVQDNEPPEKPPETSDSNTTKQFVKKTEIEIVVKDSTNFPLLQCNKPPENQLKSMIGIQHV